MGYDGYADFQDALKDFVNTGLSLPERADLKGIKDPSINRFQRGILEELINLKYLYEHIDVDVINKFIDYLEESDSIYVTGARLSYTFAYYLGWSLTKVRRGIHIVKGSDSTAMDWLTNAPEKSLVIPCGHHPATPMN